MDYIAAARAALEATYDGTCTIKGTQKVKVGGETTQQEVTIVTDESCSVSQTELKTVTQTESKAEIKYNAKLFMAPEIVVPPGSIITAQQYGQTYSLKSSGKPFVYETHQEILAMEDSNA